MRNDSGLEAVRSRIEALESRQQSLLDLTSGLRMAVQKWHATLSSSDVSDLESTLARLRSPNREQEDKLMKEAPGSIHPPSSPLPHPSLTTTKRRPCQSNRTPGEDRRGSSGA
jgi:hypothetical protein